MKDIRAVRLILSTMLDAFFKQTVDINPADWQIYAGISDKMTVDLKPPKFRDTQRALKLNIVSRYGILTWKEKVKFLKEDNTYFFKLPANFNDLATASLKNRDLLLTLTYDFKRRADLVLDDEKELAACAFPYSAVATALSAPVRKKVYGQGLGKIRPPMDEDEISTGFFNQGSTFYVQAADKATYSAGDWSYYGKWLFPASEKSEDRIFEFDHLSDEYLVNNFKPFDLQIDFVYFLFSIDTGGLNDASILFKSTLDLDKYVSGSESMKIEAIYRTNVPDVPQLLQYLNERIRALKKENIRHTATLTIFYSVDGSKDEPDFFKEAKNVIHSVTLSNLEQAVDPQYMVQQIRGLPFYSIEKDQTGWDYKRWLKELVRLRFSEHWVWFTNNSYQQMYYTPDRERLFLSDLRAEINKAQGPIREKLNEFLKKAESDQTLYMVRRGWKYGSTKRIVGSDDNYVYIYHNADKVMVRLPMYAFWKDVNVMQISSDIYDQTKWIIPFSKIVVWGGLAVMSFSILGGTQVVSWGYRTYIEEKIRDVATETVLKVAGVYDEIMKRLKLMFINLILSLFPSRGDNKAYMVIGFMRGFITGYTVDSFKSMFQKWHSLAMLEPSSIRTIKLIMRVEAGVAYLNERISALKPFLDEKAAELMMNKFVHTFADTITALIGIINNVYYLEYDQAREFLNIFTDFTGRKPITKKEWDEMRHKRFLQTFKAYTDEIKEAGLSIKEMYEDTKTNLRRLQRVVQAIEAFLIIEVATGGLLVAMIMYALAKTKDFAAFSGKQLGIYVLPGTAVTGILGFALSDEFRDTVFDVVKDFGKLLDKGLTFVLGQTFNVERMQRLGTFVGHVWGGFSLNKAVFGKQKKWTERWKTQNPAKFLGASFLRKEMTISPLLPIIKLCLFNYVILIQDVVKASVKEWELIQDDIEEILKPDEEFGDIILEDNNLSIVRIMKIILAIETRLSAWLVELSQIPELSEKIGEMTLLIDKVTPDKMPTFKDLQQGEDLGEWSKEAFMFIMLSHLHTSLKMFQNALEGIYTPLPQHKDLSISHLLGIIGLQLNETEANEVLDRDFDKTFADDK